MSTFPLSSATYSSPPSSIVDDKTTAKRDVVRNTVTFHASIWGDQFLIYDEKEDIGLAKQVECLKEEVRKELMIAASFEPHQYMKLIEIIDAVQRLGLAYHFREEIGEALTHIFITYGDKGIDSNNLESTAIWFRLLRQHGFNVSSEIFKDHMDEKGNVKEFLCNDAQGLLALYEATYMRVGGEEVLDCALVSTKLHLDIIAKDPSCDSSLRNQIQQALKQPIRRRIPRLEAVRYIPIYEQQASHNEILLKLSKLDFNVVQSMHKKELSEICKWWKDLDIRNRLPYVRDRLIEGYFWILGIYFEPQNSRTRMFLMKSCMWLIVLDDTYDNYGTYEELKTFTEAVERWSMSCLYMLPEYMKLVYHELLKTHQDMEEILEKEGKSYQISYVKELAKAGCRSLLFEAKWLKDGYVPTLEEYMSNSLVTCGYAIMIARSFVGIDEVVTEDSFKWVASYPPLVQATCLILRYMDDIATHKEEQERGHVGSCIEFYQKETGVSEVEACAHFSNQIEDAWKIINRESLMPTDVPFPLLMPAINLARVCDALYKGNNDGYNHAGEEVIGYIKSLLVHPMI